MLGQEPWLEFRGTDGSGISKATDLPEKWSKDNFKWNTQLPGRGWSSPTIIGNQIWLTTAIEIESNAEEKEEKLKSAPISGLESFSKITLQAICVDRASGSVTHQVDLFQLNDPPLIHSLNSFASPTVVIDGSFAFCNFGTFGTACVDRTTGEIKWKNDQLKFDHETGPGSSPIIYRDLLIVHCDGIDSQSIVALNKTDGTIAWQTKRSGTMNPKGSYKKAFSTPTIVTIDKKDQLISAAADWLYSYDPNSGKELWKLSYGKLGFSNVPRPIIRDGMAFICTGYMRSTLMAIDLTKASQSKSEALEDSLVWRYERQVPTMPSPILVDNMIFMVSDRGIATCVDAKTGEQHWQQRLGGGFSASPIFADNKLYFGNQKGELFVIAAESEYKLLAKNQMDSAVMATPAAVDNQLIIRTKDSIYRIEN